MTKQTKADLSLIFVTLGWGISFILTKNSLESMAPLNFLAIRFIVATTIAALFFMKRVKKMDSKVLIHGFIIGFVLYLGYIFQTIGLQYTTASNSGFITGFYVVLTPIMSTMILKERPSNPAIIGIVFALVGLALMSIKEGFHINIGDFLTFISAFAFALHIIVVGKYTSQHDSIVLGIIQIGVVGLLSLVGSLIFETPTMPQAPGLWFNILVLAIVCTAGAFIIQNVAQRYTTATHTALIYVTEPVFAAFFAYILLNETLGTRGTIGAILIFIGMLNAEVVPAIKKRREKKAQNEKIS